VLGLLLFAATCFLAYANGANDNFKGVASLFGSALDSPCQRPTSPSAPSLALGL
jgi:PiT family inorganic phosphate transporter